VARRPHTPLTYRPALDGLRALAVLGVLVFHLWPNAARGGWLGVDLFFVLSGYLITTLLVREYVQRGGIDLRGFWLARARRLMPTLVVVLLAVLVMATFWTLPSRRYAVSLDVLSTLAYVANWHFISGDEAYFASNGTPSPLRHAWSLAIEEQYYLLFPLLLLALTRFLTRRRHLAFWLLALAAASALWMAHLYVPGVDPTRVYYGTDTRAFELLIGAAAGAWIGPSQWGHARPAPWLLWLERLAWPALFALVIAMLTFDESSSGLFRGGLVAFCVVALVPILAAASPHPNSFQHVLSFEWLRRLGLISYALYLWHWPLHVYLAPERLGLDAAWAGVVQAVAALVLATATYRFVEQPVRRGGVRALWPRSPASRRLAPIAAAAAALVVAGGALALPHVSGGGSDLEAGSGGGELTYAMKTYTPGEDVKAILVGNSIPHSLFANFPQTRFPDLQLTESARFGCTTFAGQESSGGQPVPSLSKCDQFHDDWYYGLAGRDTMLYFLPQNLLNDYAVDGRMLRAGSAEHDAFVRSSLDGVAQKAKQQNITHPYLVDLSCHRVPTIGTDPTVVATNDTAKVEHLNDVAKGWASSNGVTLIDQFGFLCPGGQYHGRINGVNLYADGLHFTSESGPIFWNWLAPQIQQHGDGSGASSTSSSSASSTSGR